MKFPRIFSRVREQFKGAFASVGSGRPKRKHYYLGEHSWRSRCEYYDKIVERHSLAKQAVFTIAGQLVAEGVFTVPTERMIDEKMQPYPESERSAQLCDDLNERIGLDCMLYNTAVDIAKYGSCFWEKTISPQFDVRRIPMQESIEPEEMDEIGNVVRWQQNLFGTKGASWSNEEIIHFCWGVTSQTYPYGTSILVGLDTELEVLEELEANAKDYMEKQAWPYEVLQLGDGTYRPTSSEVSSVESKWKSRAVGENIITSYPSDLKQGGTGGAPIRELSNILDFLKDNIVDGTMIPPISKQYNATEASAKVMMPHAHATIVRPLQRIIRRKIEEEIYKPYLEDLGRSVKTCPNLLFEPPNARREEDAEYFSKMCPGEVIIPPKAVAEELGYGDEYAEWEEKKEQEKEEMMQQQSQEDEGEDGDVWEVRRRSRKSG